MTDKQKLPNEMTNSHILVQSFDYHEPTTLDEAIALNDKYGRRARLMVGGTNVLTNMKMEKDAPEVIISLSRVAELDGISKLENGGLKIGANVTIHEIRHDSLVNAAYPALAEACAAFGSTQIQIMGTIGGNICNGSPASDTVPALLVFDAVLLLKSANGERQLPLADFLLGPGKTALKEGEILKAVLLPPQPVGSASTFLKISRVAADLAKASIAVQLVREGDTINECRLAMGSVAPTAIRIPKAEAYLKGKKYTSDLLEEAGKLVSEAISPIDDIRSTAWYRRQIAGAMTVDAINKIWEGGHLASKSFADKKIARAIKTNTSSPHHIAADGRQEVALRINGKVHKVWVTSHDLLLNVLRENLALTGAKYGCGLGECGACTVLLDGRAVLSCLILAAAVEGREITTVEGLQEPDGKLDPLQQAFIDETGFQCGYCTPGFLMATKSLLNEMPKPSEDDIRDYLKGNRCRCTGYVSIVRSVIKSVELYNKKK